MNDLRVESATPHHVARIADLLSQVQRSHYQHYPSIFRNPDDVDLKALVCGYLEDEKRHVLVAIKEEAVVGYVVLELEEAKSQSLNDLPRTLSLEQIVVDQAFRRQGIATALLAAAEAKARELGFRFWSCMFGHSTKQPKGPFQNPASLVSQKKC